MDTTVASSLVHLHQQRTTGSPWDDFHLRILKQRRVTDLGLRLINSLEHDRKETGTCRCGSHTGVNRDGRVSGGVRRRRGVSTCACGEAEDVCTRVSVGGLKGGQRFAASAETSSVPLPFPIPDRVQNFFNSAPITTIQISVGATLHITHLLGLTPYRTLCFAVPLAFSPTWQVHRSFTSFLVLGLSAYEVLQRCIGLGVWQTPLERAFNGSGDVVMDGVVVKYGEQRDRGLGTGHESGDDNRKNLFEWLILDNRFLHAQVASAAVLIGIELLLWETSLSSSALTSFTKSTPITSSAALAGEMEVTPYLMYPSLEYSTRWLWAFTEQSGTILLFNILPLKPIYVPLAVCLSGGLTGWKSLLKGLVAGVVVAGVFDLRRVDGEPVVDWLTRFAREWWVLGQRLSRRWQQKDKGKRRAVANSTNNQEEDNAAASSSSQPRPVPRSTSRNIDDDEDEVPPIAWMSTLASTLSTAAVAAAGTMATAGGGLGSPAASMMMGGLTRGFSPASSSQAGADVISQSQRRAMANMRGQRVGGGGPSGVVRPRGVV
ncbi:hypothetical protein HK102_002293 [Quaeritorhiza haematococci]|nr:hypothetical protein HK102_002293 [Quaeritorhiza haematococci]